jgi:Fur family ferric uptake transcriptional regulator
MKEEKLLRKILEENNYKVTKGRLLIFKQLYGQEPQSMASLVTSTATSIDRVSVYRIVTLYEKLGVVKRINIGWKYKLELSDIFLDHHHHASCLGCGRMVAIEENKEVEKMIENLGKASGFTLISHQLELQGYCSECKLRVLL